MAHHGSTPTPARSIPGVFAHTAAAGKEDGLQTGCSILAAVETAAHLKSGRLCHAQKCVTSWQLQLRQCLPQHHVHFPLPVQ